MLRIASIEHRLAIKRRAREDIPRVVDISKYVGDVVCRRGLCQDGGRQGEEQRQLKRYDPAAKHMYSPTTEDEFGRQIISKAELTQLKDTKSPRAIAAAPLSMIARQREAIRMYIDGDPV